MEDNVSRRTGTQTTPRSFRFSRCAMVASKSWVYSADIGSQDNDPNKWPICQVPLTLIQME